jgi:hypothetical protein
LDVLEVERPASSLDANFLGYTPVAYNQVHCRILSYIFCPRRVRGS